MFAYQWPSPWFDSQTMKPDGPRTALRGVDERQETVKLSNLVGLNVTLPRKF